MRKSVFVMAVVVMLGAIVIPLAVKGQQGGQAGSSNIAHVDLRGPWGTMHYNLSGCTLDFVFNGHDLEPGMEYVLRFGKHVPKAGGAAVWVELGTGTSNEGGNLHLAGSGSPADIWMPHPTGTWKNKQVQLVWWNEATAKWVPVLSARGYSFTYDCPE